MVWKCWGASASVGNFVGGPAVYSIEITSEQPLTIELDTFIENSAAFIVPNGLRADGDELYFATGQTMVRTKIGDDGTPGEPETLYEIAGTLLTGGVVDDLDVDADHVYMGAR